MLSPNLEIEQIEGFRSKIDGALAAGKGQVVRVDEWGRRRLAYPVRKEMFGYYILYDFRAHATLAAEIERQLKIDERVFKYLTLVLDKNFTEESLKTVLERLAAAAANQPDKGQVESKASESKAESGADEPPQATSKTTADSATTSSETDQPAALDAGTN
jgi:small subunit ribosomal protein S6